MARSSTEAFDGWREKVVDAFRSAVSGVTPSTIELTVLGGPDGDLTSRWALTAGSVEPFDDFDRAADVILTVPWNDAMAIGRGELPTAVAYMQGRLKSSGDMAKFLELIRWSATAAFDTALQRLVAADA